MIEDRRLRTDCPGHLDRPKYEVRLLSHLSFEIESPYGVLKARCFCWLWTATGHYMELVLG
jgi:hypothetical protein